MRYIVRDPDELLTISMRWGINARAFAVAALWRCYLRDCPEMAGVIFVVIDFIGGGANLSLRMPSGEELFICGAYGAAQGWCAEHLPIAASPCWDEHGLPIGDSIGTGGH